MSIRYILQALLPSFTAIFRAWVPPEPAALDGVGPGSDDSGLEPSREPLSRRTAVAGTLVPGLLHQMRTRCKV